VDGEGRWRRSKRGDEEWIKSRGDVGGREGQRGGGNGWSGVVRCGEGTGMGRVGDRGGTRMSRGKGVRGMGEIRKRGWEAEKYVRQGSGFGGRDGWGSGGRRVE